ncbi:MAG: hypothetical protein KDB54_11930 [Solirubrobacterales bacterium]|nr:hypothetical protein [Solirubrobacterales bacterium]HRV59058.1 hypothetical protein [Solirubrobacterales bacterium]
MENVTVKGAVSVTLLALGGLAGAAIASNGGSSSSDPEPAATLKPRVRTEVIRRTIHRTKMAKPASVEGGTVQSAPAAAAPAPSTSSYTSAPVYTPSTSSSSSQPAVTSTSGSASSGGSYSPEESQESETGYESGDRQESEGQDD